MELRGYQREAAAPALSGRNSIVWLPTGAGKTRVAVHVCRRHLESRRGGKVAVLVNKVHLVDQHTEKEFHALQDAFKVTSISGDTSHKAFFADLVKKSDVVICTAQILQNALVSAEEDTHVELTDFSLLVIDECHHTHKDAVYNKIMLRYLQQKLSGERGLPQILGLTASPGTGGATSFEGAVEHILQVCPVPLSSFGTASPGVQPPPCPQDPFGERLKRMMMQIQQYMQEPDLPQDFGEGAAGRAFCRKTRVCALHLRKYNDALLIHDAVRMLDAFQCLQEFYGAERDEKDPTEQFLAATFKENRASLQALAGDQRYENPRLGKLEGILREHFQPLGTSRGIIFTRTRQSAHSLLSWLQTTATLRGKHIRAAVLTGAGYSNQTKHMTQNEQQDVIKQFRQGALNLLFSTSVAEEGLDIPECNIVVRYGLMTNEIAMMQVRSSWDRLRSPKASGVGQRGSCIPCSPVLTPAPPCPPQIRELQEVAVTSWLMKEARLSERRQRHDPDSVRLYCVNCSQAVCRGSDIRTVEDMHHVNVNPSFRSFYRVSSGKIQFQRTFRDWEPGSRIACKACSQDWGMEMLYRQVKLPILCIKNFVVETPAEKRRYKKWSAVTFPIKAFDYLEYCSDTHSLSF
uniref:RNA helicase n=1 Tax=Malurus cyaneus samueli TaxID=2593467 RepID=A0A8C5TZJ6_9PASS